MQTTQAALEFNRNHIHKTLEGCPGLGFNGVVNLRQCRKIYDNEADLVVILADFVSYDISQNGVVNQLRHR